jgi:hypothetical protein
MYNHICFCGYWVPVHERLQTQISNLTAGDSKHNFPEESFIVSVLLVVCLIYTAETYDRL